MTALAACGSSSKPSVGPAATKPPSTAGGTTTTVANAAADKAAAQALLLVEADLPDGWVGSPQETDAESVEVDRKIAECTGASAPSTRTADISGDNFDKGDAEVGSEVTFAASRSNFETDVKALRSAKYATCIETVFGKQLAADAAKDPSGATFSGLSVTRLPAPTTAGEVAVAYRLTVTISAQGVAVQHLFIDFVGYGEGRAEVSLNFNNTGSPFDPVLERLLVGKAVAKLKTSAA